ncbi:GTSE1 protein, partial [Amia calva]|nr:GTSE1 protein [Amia calva]
EFVPLAEEKFDFDISLSPTSGSGDNEDDDEVFLGPVRHKEKCVAVGLDLQTDDKENARPSGGGWSPLAGDKFVEIFKEAHLLAQRFENSTDGPRASVKPRVKARTNEVVEKFVEDSRSKLNLFNTPRDPAISPVKRETYCVQDSPFKQLPPAIQQRLLRSQSAASPIKQTSVSSSPARACKTQLHKPSLGSKAALAYASRVLPNRAMAPPTREQTEEMRSNLAATKIIVFPPPCSFQPKAALKNSPPRVRHSSAESLEDPNSDNASFTSDVSDSSLKSALPVKRMVPVPKKIGLHKPHAIKPPAQRNKRIMPDKKRGASSSSSSSLSSMNSSLSVSPAVNAGKPNSSLNSSVSKVTQTHRLAAPKAGGSLSTSVQAKKALALPSKLTKSSSLNKLSTPLRKPDPANPHQTPAESRAQRLGSVPGLSSSSAQIKTASAAKGSPKPKASVAPTPTGYFRGAQQSGASSPDNASRIMKPKRLMTSVNDSVSATDCFQTPTLTAKTKSAMSKLRRCSALPTPVNRRTSGIPALTPKSVTRRSVFSLTSETLEVSLSTKKRYLVRDPRQCALQSHSVSRKEPCPPSPIPLCSMDFSPEEEDHPNPPEQESAEVPVPEVP